jgi:hypothetical protein
LAYLMLNYCKLEVDKQYQLADWRIRPLPAELINYAREDTHYLLYIFDVMRNQLIDRGNEQGNLLVSVYERSKTIAAKVYQKPNHKDDDFLELYRKSKKIFSNQQMAALKELHSWRDYMARAEDESLGYVLPNHMLLQIVEILPRERQGVLACCNPIPPLVRQNLMEIHNIVLQAREIALTKVEKAPVLQPSALQHPKYDAESLLTCPHDQTRIAERIAQAEHGIVDQDKEANRSCLSSQVPSYLVKPAPTITAFLAPRKQSLSKSLVQKIVAEIKASFRSPFTKYLPTDGDSIRPQASDMWTLKASTAPKRKADDPDDKVDLNTFQPEFAKPSKKSKTGTSTKQARHLPTSGNENVSAGGSSLFRIPAAKDRQMSSSSSDVLNPHQRDGSQKTDELRQKETTEDTVERQIKSLRQEMVAKKKKLKVKEAKREKSKANIAVDISDTTQTSMSMHADDVHDSVDPVPSPATQSSRTVAGTDTNIEQNISSASRSDSSDVRTKKKKKKKLSLADVQENFEAFDYAAAQKHLSQQKRDKPKMDVFNPSLPSRSGKNKNKMPRAKLSGPKSNKAATFPMSGMPQKNKGKKH